jgi:hypothetical protein
MIQPERDYEKALGVRPSVSAVTRTLLPNPRVRIRDARPRRAAAVIR